MPRLRSMWQTRRFCRPSSWDFRYSPTTVPQAVEPVCQTVCQLDQTSPTSTHPDTRTAPGFQREPTRTNLLGWFRKPVLYPPELRGRGGKATAIRRLARPRPAPPSTRCDCCLPRVCLQSRGRRSRSFAPSRAITSASSARARRPTAPTTTPRRSAGGCTGAHHDHRAVEVADQVV